MAGSRALVPLAAALLALPQLAAGSALAKHRHHPIKADGTTGAGKVNSSAYPDAPGGMPAASDRGKPVEPKADAGAKPDAPAKASTEGTAPKEATPSTAYPNAPGGTPAAGDQGKPIKP